MKKVTISNVEQLREALEAAATVSAVEAILIESSVRALRSYAKQENYYFGKPLVKVTKDELVRAILGSVCAELEVEPEVEDEYVPESEQEAGDTVTKLIDVTGLMFEEFTTAMENNAAEVIDSNSYEEVYEKLMTVDKVTMNFICSWFEIGEAFYHDPKKDKKEKVAKKYAKLIWEKIERVFPSSVQETPSTAIIASIPEVKTTVIDIESKPEAEAEPEVEDAGVSGYHIATTHGRMFCEGKISKEYLLEQLHRPDYQTKYYGYAYGLAEIFDIAQGYDDESVHTWINYSYEELLPQLEEFIENYELKVDPVADYEQETGFAAYCEKGEGFIRSEVSAEEILNKLKIPNYPGMVHGLATAFHIPIKGKSYSELIASIAEFVKDYDKPLNIVESCGHYATAAREAM